MGLIPREFAFSSEVSHFDRRKREYDARKGKHYPRRNSFVESRCGAEELTQSARVQSMCRG